MVPGREQNAEPNRGKMAATEVMEEAAAMRGREEYWRFDWSGFFKVSMPMISLCVQLPITFYLERTHQGFPCQQPIFMRSDQSFSLGAKETQTDAAPALLPGLSWGG